MADTKISALSDGGAIQATDSIPIVRSGANYKATIPNVYSSAEKSKLAGIEAAADVTDAANVESALSGASLTATAAASDDKILVQDTSNSDSLITVRVDELPYLPNVSADASPTLGGNLNTNGNSIISASGANVVITPGTGGAVVMSGLTYPTADGTAGQAIVTDGAGNFSLSTITAGTNNVTVENTAYNADFAVGDVGRITSNGVEKTNAGAESTSKGTLVMASEIITSGNTGTFVILGNVTGLSGLTTDAVYYLDTTAGNITTTAPSADNQIVRIIGNATSTTTLQFNGTGDYTIVQTTGTSPSVIIEEVTSAAKNSGTTLTLPAPADINNGDMLIAFLSVDFTATASATTITPPSGWTQLFPYEFIASSDGVGIGTDVYYHIASAETGSAYNFTESDGQPACGALFRISGIDVNDPFDAQATKSDSTSTTEPTTSAISTNVDNTYVMAVFAWDASKTVVSANTGYIEGANAVATSGANIWAGYVAAPNPGAINTVGIDLSGNTRWKSWHLAVKQENATITSGGTSTGLGPFPIEEDGLGYTHKLTLPINSAGQLSGTTDAYEIFCSNDPSYTPGEPDLITYSHPTYFIRNASAFRFSSPIRPGAYTSSNSNGPARSEFRHMRNYSITERIRFKSTIRLIQAAANSKGTTVQIHRNPGSPVIKGNWLVASDGNSWTFRALIKRGDNMSDESFSSGFVTLASAEVGDKGLAGGLSFDTDYTVEYDYDPVAETFKCWFNTANTNTPSITVTQCSASNQSSYIKAGGVYPSFAGNGAESDLWITELRDFVLIDVSGNEVSRP